MQAVQILKHRSKVIGSPVPVCVVTRRDLQPRACSESFARFLGYPTPAECISQLFAAGLADGRNRLWLLDPACREVNLLDAAGTVVRCLVTHDSRRGEILLTEPTPQPAEVEQALLELAGGSIARIEQRNVHWLRREEGSLPAAASVGELEASIVIEDRDTLKLLLAGSRHAALRILTGDGRVVTFQCRSVVTGNLCLVRWQVK